MVRSPSPESNAAAVRLDVLESPEGVAAIVVRITERGGRIRTIATVRALETDPPQAEIEVEVDGLMPDELLDALDGLPEVQAIRRTRALGSITEHVDLVVSDPVQAGTMAVMAIADTASFDLVRQKGRRY